MFWLMLCVDRIDALNVSGVEFAARRLLMIQRAVRRNPRAPDFEGLECFTTNAIDSAGGVATLEFEKFMADIQKAEAQVLKQQRMARVETEAAEKRKRDGKGGKSGKGDANAQCGG